MVYVALPREVAVGGKALIGMAELNEQKLTAALGQASENAHNSPVRILIKTQLEMQAFMEQVA